MVVLLLVHGNARDSRDRSVVAHARLRIHAFHRDDTPQSRIRGRMGQFRLARRRSCIIGDEMEVLAIRCGDAKGLLHQAVGFVAVAVRLAVVLVLVTSPAGRIRCLSAHAPQGVEAATSLALHLAVCQEAAGNAACTPGLAIGPAPHTCLPLIPDENRTGPDGLALLFGQPPLYTRQ